MNGPFRSCEVSVCDAKSTNLERLGARVQHFLTEGPWVVVIPVWGVAAVVMLGLILVYAAVGSELDPDPPAYDSWFERAARRIIRFFPD